MPYLPPEILGQIGEFADSSTLQACRLASKTFQAAIHSSFLQLFEYLNIDIKVQHEDDTCLQHALQKVKNALVGNAVKEIILRVSRPNSRRCLAAFTPNYTPMAQLLRHVPACTRVRVSLPDRDYGLYTRVGADYLTSFLTEASAVGRSLEAVKVDEGALESLESGATAIAHAKALHGLSSSHMSCCATVKSLSLPFSVGTSAKKYKLAFDALYPCSSTVVDLNLSIAGWCSPAVANLFYDLKADPNVRLDKLRKLSLRAQINYFPPAIDFVTAHLYHLTHLTLTFQDNLNENKRMRTELTSFAVILEAEASCLEEFWLNVKLRHSNVIGHWSNKDLIGLTASVTNWIVAGSSGNAGTLQGRHLTGHEWAGSNEDEHAIIEDWDWEDDEDDEDEGTEEYDDESDLNDQSDDDE